MSNPVTKTDLVFLKHFAMVIGVLLLIMFALIGLALHIYSDNPPAQNPNLSKIVEERIAPVGSTYAGDTGRAAMLAAQEAAKKTAAAQVAYGGTLDGKTIYDNLCHSCHTSGVGGAPKMSEKPAWAARLTQGLDTVLKHAIEGYQGSVGVMPAKGGNPALTDEQVKATVEWMINQVK